MTVKLKWRTWLAIGAGGILLLLFFLPSILLHTSLRDWVIGGALAREGIDLQIGDVRAGWFTPLRLRNTVLGPLGQPRVIAIDEIRSDRTLLSALFEGVEVGELTVRRPQIHIWVDNQGSNLDFPAVDGLTAIDDSPAVPESDDVKEVAITITDAEMWLKTRTMADEANVFRGFDVAGSLRQDAERRLLHISPGRLLDHAPVSTALCDGLLKYLVPVLAEATWVNGELSLDLTECAIDLDRPEDSKLAGTLHIHGVQAGVKNAMIAAASDRIRRLLGGEGTDTIHLADNAIVSFELRDGGVWHDGVEFGLPRISPDFVVQTSGSVSFDDELDLDIKIPIAAHFLRDGILAEAIRNQTLILNATGTIRDPKVTLDDESLFADLIANIGGKVEIDEAEPVKSLVFGIRDAIRERAEANAEVSDDVARDSDQDEMLSEPAEIQTPILDRLRERRRSRGGLLRRK